MNTPTNQNNDHLAKRVLNRIVDEHLTPRPRWEFLFKNYFFWSLGALAVAFGALAFSATLFEITNVDWRLSVATHSDFMTFFLAAAPFFWVIALALFILIGYVNIRSTNHGYRYSLTVLALGAVLTSLLLGSGLYYMGFGGSLDEAIGDHSPFYRPTITAQRSWWTAPEKGVLAGNAVAVDPSLASFTLRDFSGRDWKVDSDDLPNRDITLVARGGAVRVVGIPNAATSTEFHACFVFPWEMRGISQTQTLPPPLALVASTSGKRERSSECKGIRPYGQLHAIEDNF